IPAGGFFANVVEGGDETTAVTLQLWAEREIARPPVPGAVIQHRAAPESATYTVVLTEFGSGRMTVRAEATERFSRPDDEPAETPEADEGEDPGTISLPEIPEVDLPEIDRDDLPSLPD